MKKIHSVLIASALVLGATACSSNSKEVIKEESNSTKGTEEKEKKESSSEKAISDMKEFFTYIDEENNSKVAELLRHTEGSNEVPNEKDVNGFIKEWKTYNFKEKADLQIIDISDLRKNEREETENFQQQVFWIICKYEGDAKNKFSKLLAVAAYNGEFYMVDDVPADEGIDSIKKDAWEKYGLTDSDGVKPKEMPAETNIAVKVKELKPNKQENKDASKKNEFTEKGKGASDGSNPPVEQVAPQKEYDYDNPGRYIIGDAALANVLNQSFSAYHDLVGKNMVEFQRDGDFGFSVTTDTKTIYVLFKSKDGKNWAITDLKTGEKLIENGVKVGEQKVRLFDSTDFDYSNSKGYIVSDKEFADLLNNAFIQHPDVVGTKMISFHRKDDYLMVVQTDKRNLNIEIIEGGEWMISDHNTALPLLENE
ncbi:hypothetical protein [Priestia megaterium]|uniref:hypothetical protein n=1 Tax=Priestia megaterium TaxID=1404 RepID=UPI003241CF25